MATREDKIKTYNRYVGLRKKTKIRNDLELANMIGMSPSSFTDWKNGVSQPNTIHMMQIARALNVPLEKLVKL